ncbi:serine/threonine-protein kinase [Streptomyces prunicolor]|uniref:serine/threonine-protein kinase n=1 Tax=Streptomyces prunicolor TaxID=67348 RepID=UPI0033DD3B72
MTQDETGEVVVRGTLLAGRFRITDRLGVGGMGEVWAARDERMRRDVAVKLVHPLFGTDEAATRSRFEREVQLAGRLTHPNIVTVHDWGELPAAGHQVLHLVMERVPGVSLHRRLRDESAPPWPVAVAWTAQIAQALDAAHRRGVVHRDIKPANALLTPEGTVKVVDFGVAKFLGDTLSARHLTAPGQLLGSPHYMSPEQALGDLATDHRGDLYSLGCLLHHALTGRPPFDDANLVKVLRRHQDEVPVPPGDVVDGLPAALDDLAAGLLAKRPGDRPADAAAVLDVLTTVLVTEADGPELDVVHLGHAHSAAGHVLRKAWGR